LKINSFFSGGEPKDRIIKIDKLKRYANFGLRNEILNFAELWVSAMMANILKVIFCLISKTFITINQLKIATTNLISRQLFIF